MGSRAAVRTGPPRAGDYLACALSSREPYRIITPTIHPVRAHGRCSRRVGLRICESVFLAAPPVSLTVCAKLRGEATPILCCAHGKLTTRPGQSDWRGDPQSPSVQQAGEHSTSGLGCLYHLTPSLGLPPHTYLIASNMPALSSRPPLEKQAWGHSVSSLEEAPVTGSRPSSRRPESLLLHFSLLLLGSFSHEKRQIPFLGCWGCGYWLKVVWMNLGSVGKQWGCVRVGGTCDLEQV